MSRGLRSQLEVHKLASKVAVWQVAARPGSEETFPIVFVAKEFWPGLTIGQLNHDLARQVFGF